MLVIHSGIKRGNDQSSWNDNQHYYDNDHGQENFNDHGDKNSLGDHYIIICMSVNMIIYIIMIIDNSEEVKSRVSGYF